MISDRGLKQVRDAVVDVSYAGVVGLAVGAGSTLTTVGDTCLVAEFGRAVVANATDSSVHELQSVGEFNSMVLGSVAEVGVFDNSTSSTAVMFARRVLSSTFVKTDTQELRIRYKIRVV